jgi:Short C-terminal domain
LPRVQLSGGSFDPAPAAQPVFQAPQPPQPVTYNNPAPSFSGNPQPAGDILSAIERLGQLYQQGVLSEDEFRQKKADLLSRL